MCSSACRDAHHLCGLPFPQHFSSQFRALCEHMMLSELTSPLLVTHMKNIHSAATTWLNYHIVREECGLCEMNIGI